MLGLMVFTTVIFLLLYWYFTRHFNHWKNKNIPFIKPLPFFGNVLNGITMRQCMGEIFYDLYYKKEKPVIGFFVLDRPCLLIRDPQIIKRILVTDFKYFCDRTIMTNKRDDPISTYLLFFLKNPEWKQIRTQITPVFTSSKIKNMSKLTEDASQEMIDFLNEKIKSSLIIETKDLFLRYTVNVISSTAFGIEANCFKNQHSEFYTAAKRITDWDDKINGFRMRCYFLAHWLVKLFRMAMFDPVSIQFLKKNFLEVMYQRAVSKNSRNDLIDILLQMKNDDKHFIEGDILVSQAVIFFVGGYETSSSTMAFALYEMALHPEIQKTLRNEITNVSEKLGGINYDSLKEMHYLDMCIKEVLRKYPILPFMERKCNTRYTIPETGAVIEKETPIFVSNLALHYDPQYFPNPEKFDPERFSDDNKDHIETFSYLPFGEGPRGCLGRRFGMLTVKLGLANILKHFVLEVCAETPKNMKFKANAVTLSPIDNTKLKFSKI